MSRPSDIDIFRSAKLLLDQHGADAVIHAAIKADEMLSRGDLEGRATWMRVIDALTQIADNKAKGSLH